MGSIDEIKPWITAGNILGEGPIYLEDSKELCWIDIAGKSISRSRIDAKGGREVYPLPVISTVLAEIEGRPDELILGTENGFALWNWKDKSFRPLVDIWKNDPVMGKKSRLNDGNIDCRGRFWAGSMIGMFGADETGNSSLYRLDSDLSVHTMLDGISIANGLGWNSDNTVMYFADSHDRTVWAFDFDAESGSISNKRAFYIHDGEAVPDGLAVDADGNVWLALWEGYAVLQISPEGEVIRKIDLPVSRVTCPCFGGPDFDELFITSAMLDPERPVGVEGCVFRLKVGVRGRPRNRFVMGKGVTAQDERDSS
ncbi:uncharacterized protein PV06_09381 [Exophiala oligosperma]|uniref:SMP-30/Gluconolactonase/LRE-like region domain-containing protein n=2 Tax=Chaetothyriales TaxID=34395 RepID=A0A0D2AE28_9EURO|nr:uncharacterized protein PV06_09381 [Exophiala oligosperma]KAJ9635334.1 rRNA-processing protein cgr1 [Knufia peltigerae]KIW38416.1 hypothetical protein PV06_09381 [Exophiala oligosperma]